MVRAFSFFSHLLNIAEDEQQHRRRRAHAEAGSPRRPGSLAHALERVREAGVDAERLLAWFGRARVSPVLTAHPTEVRRKSTIDVEQEIARLMAERDCVPPTPEESRAREEALRHCEDPRRFRG